MWLVSVRLRAAMTEASWSKQRRVTWFVAVWFPTMLRDTKATLNTVNTDNQEPWAPETIQYLQKILDDFKFRTKKLSEKPFETFKRPKF